VADLPMSGTVPDEMKLLRAEAAELRAETARLRTALAALQHTPPAGSAILTGSDPGNDGLEPTRQHSGLSHADLLRSEDRLHAIVESAVDYAIITADFQDRITGWNSSATRLLGWEPADVLGRPCKLIFTPEDCAAGVPEAEMLMALNEGRAVDERWHVRRDGTRFWAMGELLPLHDGELLGYLKILRDCTEQRRAEEALRESEQRYRLIVESARDYAIFTTDLQGRITSWNRGAREVLGWDESEALGRPHSILYTPEDHLAGVPEAEMAKGLTEGHAQHDRWHLRADGTRIWGTEVMTPLQDGDGETHGYLKILRDRTDQKREEEQRTLLLAELNHRAKNTLAIVQYLVSQTAVAAATPCELREALQGRLDALASAHDLLTREAWRGAELADVVQATLAPYDARVTRIEVSGPKLRLTPNAALVLNMALNELATNAAKYGALSTPLGGLEVSWSLDRPPEAAAGGALDLTWRERGGPAVAASPHPGFGSRLIEEGVSYQLGGHVDLRFLPEGVECRFRLPMTRKLGGI